MPLRTYFWAGLVGLTCLAGGVIHDWGYPESKLLYLWVLQVFFVILDYFANKD